MELTKKRIIELYSSLGALADFSGAKFAYAITKNISILKPEITAIQEGIKNIKEYQEYEKERIKLAESHSKKDENGNFLKKITMTGESYDIENQGKFEKDFEKLKEKYAKGIKEYEDFLKTNCKVTLHQMSHADLPETITGRHLNSINEILL